MTTAKHNKPFIYTPTVLRAEQKYIPVDQAYWLLFTMCGSTGQSELQEILTKLHTLHHAEILTKLHTLHLAGESMLAS